MADKPFRVVITGEGGAGDQVFEADTAEEFQTKFHDAQTNATAKIRELAQELAAERAARQQLEQAVEPVASAESGEFNRQDYFNALYNQPVEAFKKVFTAAAGVAFDDVMSRFQDVTQKAEAVYSKEIADAFLERHPELAQMSPEEVKKADQVIAEIMKENNWPATVNNLEAAFLMAASRGQVKAPAAEPQGELIPPVPTTVTRPSVQANTSESEAHFLSTAPTEKVREYLEKKFAAAQRP